MCGGVPDNPKVGVKEEAGRGLRVCICLSGIWGMWWWVTEHEGWAVYKEGLTAVLFATMVCCSSRARRLCAKVPRR